MRSFSNFGGHARSNGPSETLGRLERAISAYDVQMLKEMFPDVSFPSTTIDTLTQQMFAGVSFPRTINTLIQHRSHHGSLRWWLAFFSRQWDDDALVLVLTSANNDLEAAIDLVILHEAPQVRSPGHGTDMSGVMALTLVLCAAKVCWGIKELRSGENNE